MPGTIKQDSILLKVDIYQKKGRVEFCVMQTPAPLWEILPRNPQFIEVDYTDTAHYYKRFSVSYKGMVYEFTFYLSSKIVDK